MPERPLSAVVLAAGEGIRMRSSRPKPLHRLCGRPMILYVLDALAELHVRRVVVVVGHRAEWVTKALLEHASPALQIEFVGDNPPNAGSGDALAVALTAFPESLVDAEGDVVVLPGDTPLVRPSTLGALVKHHRETESAATLLTAVLDDPAGYDRVVRGKNEDVIRVVEDAEVTRQEAGITEIATAIACYRHSVLAPAVRRLRPQGRGGEHSLMGIADVLHDAGYTVSSMVMDDPMEAAGVNDRAQLAVAEAELRDRINERWMRHGVTMWDPERTYVDATVTLEPDVVLLPGTVLQGECRISEGAEIGPDTRLIDTVVGIGAIVAKSTADRAVIGTGARVGPFAVLEPGAEVLSGTRVLPHSVVEGHAPAS